tara:strand:+ start:371 stop:592 length:222 start_codon:yes stop_codon:yes gene_type:complete
MPSEKTGKRLEPGSWCEINTKLKDKQLLKIVGYRGEFLHCIDDEGRMTMLKPNSAKVSRIFQVKPDGKVVDGL